MQFDPVENDDLERSLKALKEQEEEELVVRAATNYGVAYVDLLVVPIETDALRLIPEDKARAGQIVAFALKGRVLKVALHAMNDPIATELIDSFRKQEFDVVVHLASTKSLERAFERYQDLSLSTRSHGSFVDISPDAISSITSRVTNNADVRVLFQELMSNDDAQMRTTKIIELIMGSAVATKTSDVHVEPQEEMVRLRFRQDGILEDIIELAPDVYKSVAGRFKVLSGLKINLVKEAQDGRFTIDFENTEIEVRVSTIPGPYGEGIVMRLLDPRSIMLDFDQLGIEPFLLDIFKREIAKPDGIILTTGPTGSGKTTTLYTFLRYVYDPEIKVITIEDPIEYHLAGIQQTQVDHAKGYDFMAGLRAAMRQDPEVILVGEIRDKETAVTAVQAAQTGHLVFSTLHTNNAAGVIPRLLALEVNPSLLASTLRLMIAQRLARTLYTTKVKRPATPPEARIIRAVLKRAEHNGKDMKGRYGFSSDMEFEVYDPVPAPESPSGYKGRVGIYEAIAMDRAIEELLEKNPTERLLRDMSQKQGILTMAEDAIVKVLQGVTSFVEVDSVVDLEVDLEEFLDAEPASDATIQKAAVDYGASKLAHTFQGVTHEETHTYSPPSIEPSSSLREIGLLSNYLKRLEMEQEVKPSKGISQEIAQVQSVILNIIKQTDMNQLVIERDTGRTTRDEINLLMNDLKNLEQNQIDHPDSGVAEQLRDIRNQVERLAK
jgi:type IV pilus assembly protein PilB